MAMTQGFWSLYAPVYEPAMRPDKKAYAWLYHRIPKVIMTLKARFPILYAECTKSSAL